MNEFLAVLQENGCSFQLNKGEESRCLKESASAPLSLAAAQKHTREQRRGANPTTSMSMRKMEDGSRVPVETKKPRGGKEHRKGVHMRKRIKTQ